MDHCNFTGCPVSVELNQSIRDLRSDVREDIEAAVRPIVAHLEKLNNRTAKGEVEVAVLKTKLALLGSGLGLAGGTVATLLLEWLR